MIRRLALTIAVAAGLIVPAQAAEAAPINHTVAAQVAALARIMPPCRWEDGSGGKRPGYWDATKRGDRRGSSYWVDRNYDPHYLKARVMRWK